MFRAIETSASGLTAQRLRLDVIANNLANAQTTRTEQGGPYRRQFLVFEARQGRPERLAPTFTGYGVRAVRVEHDASPPRLVHDPGHPDADAAGFVAYPNVEVVTEMVDLISATRAYEANVAAVGAAKEMALRALDIGRA